MNDSESWIKKRILPMLDYMFPCRGDDCIVDCIAASGPDLPELSGRDERNCSSDLDESGTLSPFAALQIAGHRL